MEENISANQQPAEPQEQPENKTQCTAPYRGTFPTWIDLLVFFGIFFVSQVVGMLVALIVGVSMPDTELLKSADAAVVYQTEVAMGNYNALTYLITMSLTLIGILGYRRRRRGPHAIARFSLKGLNPVLLGWGLVMIVAASVVLEPLLALLPEVPNIYGRGLGVFMTVVIFAPLFEEFIFRGIVLESVRARYGAIWALLIPAVMFGLIHLLPALMLNAAVVGLILGFIYLRSDSIWATIILHAVNNGVAFLLLMLGMQNKVLSDLIGSSTLYGIVYVAASIVFITSGYMVYRVLGRLAEAPKNIASE